MIEVGYKAPRTLLDYAAIDAVGGRIGLVSPVPEGSAPLGVGRYLPAVAPEMARAPELSAGCDSSEEYDRRVGLK